MKVLFATNIPSPYRVDFFNELGKYCELTVCYERKTSSERDKTWKGDCAKSFNEVYLDLKPVGTDRSKGHALKEFIKTYKADILILTNYVSPATMEAIAYCRFHRIPYYIEYDGGFNKKDTFIKYILKKFLIGGAKGHLTTADEHKKYLMSLGIKEDIIFKYPFTSIRENDINKIGDVSPNKKKLCREKLEITEDKVILSVGQFIHRKGFDILLQAVSRMDRHIGVYIVGGQPTQEYLDMQKQLILDNVHFVGFKQKSELAEYYIASDLFVMPTREDIWGLVINEAMAYGLPVVSSDACIAALELVKDGENGYVVPREDCRALSDKMQMILNDEADESKYSKNSLEIIRNYTIEKMAQRHIEIFDVISQ